MAIAMLVVWCHHIDVHNEFAYAAMVYGHAGLGGGNAIFTMPIYHGDDSPGQCHVI